MGVSGRPPRLDPAPGFTSVTLSRARPRVGDPGGTSFCTSITEPAADSFSTAAVEEQCNADATGRLIGRPRPTGAEAMRITHSTTVRPVEAGQMVTHDFRMDRVTIETDPASGSVVGARCG